MLCSILFLSNTSQTPRPSQCTSHKCMSHEGRGPRVSTKRASVNVRAGPPELSSMSSRGQERRMNSLLFTHWLYSILGVHGLGVSVMEQNKKGSRWRGEGGVGEYRWGMVGEWQLVHVALVATTSASAERLWSCCYESGSRQWGRLRPDNPFGFPKISTLLRGQAYCMVVITQIKFKRQVLLLKVFMAIIDLRGGFTIIPFWLGLKSHTSADFRQNSGCEEYNSSEKCDISIRFAETIRLTTASFNYILSVHLLQLREMLSPHTQLMRKQHWTTEIHVLQS